MTKNQELDALYARLPRMDCKRKCQGCCGPIGMSNAELERVTEDRGYKPDFLSPLQAMSIALVGKEEDLTCPLLDRKSGACMVYPIRPMICRLWGLVKAMACPHGCVPERWVSEEESRDLLREARRIGG